MNTNTYIPVKNDFALTVKKEYRLMVINKITKTTIRISCKSLLYALIITIVNMFV